MGVILFSMLFGELPFGGDTNLQIKNLICEGNYVIPQNVGKNLSEECKDALKLMLDVNPATRITAVELQSHPWILEKS